MLKFQSSTRVRLAGVAVLMAFAAGCGGGGGGDPGVSPPPPPVGPPPVANPFGPASVVLGQSGFDRFDEEGETATPLVAPVGRSAVTSDGKLLAVSGGGVVVFGNYDAVNGPVAESEFSLVHNESAVPVRDFSTQGTKVVAAAGHMVFIYNSTPAGPVEADVTAGEETPGCSAFRLREPGSAYLTPTGRLVVADSFNNRVLIWNNVAEATGALGDADVVLGQPHMITCSPNVEGDDDGDGLVDPSTNQSLYLPMSVWSDGLRLVVADNGNHRVLIWDDIREIGDFQAADHVIGQADFVAAQPNRGQAVPSGATLFSPASVDVSADGELAVADSENNRVLIWRAIPQVDGQAADHVLGQSDFAHRAQNDPDQTGQDGALPSAKTLAGPGGVRFDGRNRNLIVNDTGNHRVLVWRELD